MSYLAYVRTLRAAQVVGLRASLAVLSCKRWRVHPPTLGMTRQMNLFKIATDEVAIAFRTMCPSIIRSRPTTDIEVSIELHITIGLHIVVDANGADLDRPQTFLEMTNPNKSTPRSAQKTA
ncbi:hypothetical protein KC345_g86 [Hortaea werneckii]|nr:hypothetical protein KC345_g86 [Hortaea werneckii]